MLTARVPALNNANTKGEQCLKAVPECSILAAPALLCQVAHPEGLAAMAAAAGAVHARSLSLAGDFRNAAGRRRRVAEEEGGRARSSWQLAARGYH